MSDYDYTTGVTTDRQNVLSATKNIENMIFILEKARKPQKNGQVGFTDDDCYYLLVYWLTIGQWIRGSGYATSNGWSFDMLRMPRAIPGGTKYSTRLLDALRIFRTTNDRDMDSSHRRRVFDDAQDRMLDFMYAYHQAKEKQDPEAARAFRAKLHELPRAVAKDYKFRW